MMGMEMMFSKMIGMTPDELKAEVERFRAMAEGTAALVVQMASDQAAILAKLEGMQNGSGE